MQRCVSPCLDLGPCARFPAVLKQGLSTGVHGRKGNHRTLLSPIIEGALSVLADSEGGSVHSP